ncbi:helix-turn-helix domain-containing protein [Ekhidna sp.]|uniref:helix-turn-helix domain-containing protein n=1 Tax=Ekhidna sp. TaxID=2608089 RepID=UPI003CCC2976
MTALRFILFILALLGIFISGALFFRKPWLRNRSIALFITLYSFQILEFLYATSEILELYPQFVGLYIFPSGLLYGPVFYFHVRSFDASRDGLKAKHLLHFIPSILMVVLMRDVYLEFDGKARLEILTSEFFPRFLYYNYSIAIHVSIYAIICFITIRKFFSSLEITNKVYLSAVFCIYIACALLFSFFVEFANNWRDFTPYYFCVSLFFLFIGFLLYSNPKFLTQLGGKYLSSTLSKAEMEIIVNRVINLFETEKIFLNKDLSLSEVATSLDIPSHKISQTLSRLLNTNFNEFLNDFRIKFSVGLLSNPKYDHYKIEAIAIDSGFNNKVTFYKAFSRVHNETPASFRKSIKRVKEN